MFLSPHCPPALAWSLWGLHSLGKKWGLANGIICKWKRKQAEMPSLDQSCGCEEVLWSHAFNRLTDTGSVHHLACSPAEDLSKPPQQKEH